MFLGLDSKLHLLIKKQTVWEAMDVLTTQSGWSVPADGLHLRAMQTELVSQILIMAISRRNLSKPQVQGKAFTKYCTEGC